MNNIEQCLQADRLRAMTSTIASPTNRPQPGFGFWQQCWQLLTYTLTRTAELRVWQRLDRFGNRYWYAYDPTTGRSTTSGSKAEIKAWIEELRHC